MVTVGGVKVTPSSPTTSATNTKVKLSVTHTTCTHTHAYIHNSYLTEIGMHEMRGRMHPNYCQKTILLVVDLCSSLAYFMMTQPLPIAGKLPIKTLGARQLPTSHTHIQPCIIQYMYV